MDSLVSGHGPIDYLVVAAFVLYAIWAGATQTRRILYIIPAALTFYFFVNLGAWVTPYKLVPFAFLGTVLFVKGGTYFTFEKSSWFNAIVLVFLAATLISSIMIFRLPPNPFYSPVKRLLIQLFSQVNLLLLFYIVKKECSSSKRLYQFFRIYLITTTILCLYGLYQVAANQFGLPFRGIVYTDRAVGAAFDKLNMIFRINSLANEPKRLSYMLGISVVLLIVLKNALGKDFFSGTRYWVLLILHLVCIFLTYATSIFLILAVFILLVLILSLVKRSTQPLSRYVAYGAILLVLASPWYLDRALLLYRLRVLDQVQYLEEVNNVRMETVGIDYLKKYPATAVLGVGPGFYSFFFWEEYGFGLSSAGIEPLDSGLLAALFDYGLVGTLLLLIPLFRALSPVKTAVGRLYYQTYLPVLLFIFATTFALDPWEFYFVFVGAFQGSQQLNW